LRHPLLAKRIEPADPGLLQVGEEVGVVDVVEGVQVTPAHADQHAEQRCVPVHAHLREPARLPAAFFLGAGLASRPGSRTAAGALAGAASPSTFARTWRV